MEYTDIEPRKIGESGSEQSAVNPIPCALKKWPCLGPASLLLHCSLYSYWVFGRRPLSLPLSAPFLPLPTYFSPPKMVAAGGSTKLCVITYQKTVMCSTLRTPNLTICLSLFSGKLWIHESYPVDLPATGKKRRLVNTENICSIHSLSGSNLPFSNK